MLDRIVSEGALSNVYETAAGSGTLKDTDVYIRDLRRHADGMENFHRRRRANSPKASLQDIAALGIKVKQVGDGQLTTETRLEARARRQAERREKLKNV